MHYNGFMCCPCADWKILHTHLLYKGFMPHHNVWTRHGEIGVMMEDGEEEEDDDNYVPPEYGDTATGEVLGNVVISKKILRTRKIMLMHSNEGGECVHIPS